MCAPDMRWRVLPVLLSIALPMLVAYQAIPADAIWLSVFWLVAASAMFFLKDPGRLGFLEIYAAAVFVYLFVSVIWSHWLWVSFWVACTLSLIPMAFLIFSDKRLGNYRRYFLKAFVAIALFNAVLVIAMTIFYVRRTGGLFADANLAANLFLVATLVVLGRITSREKGVMIGEWLALFILGSAIFFAQSRAALLLLALCFVAIVVLLGKTHAKTIVGSVVTLALGYFFSEFALSAGISQSVSPLSRTESYGYRVDLWLASVRILIDYPWFGSGLGSFSLLYPAVREPTEVGSVGFFAHNDLLQLLLELGVVGFVFCFAFPLLAFIRTCKGVFALKPGSSRTEGYFLLLVVFVISAHAFVNFIIYQPLLAFSLGAALGYGVANYGAPATRFAFGATKSGRKKTAWIAGVVLVFLGMFGLFSSAVDRYADTLITEEASKGVRPSLASKAYNGVLAASYMSPLNSRVSDYLVSAETNTAIGLADMDLGKELAEKVLARIDQQAYLKKPNCDQLTEKGRLLWVLGDRGTAASSLRETLKAAPGCVQARIALADALVKIGQPNDAVELLNDGIDRIRFKEVVVQESRALLRAMEEALSAAGRENEARAIELYLRYGQ